MEKNKEISCFKDHSEKLLMKIKLLENKGQQFIKKEVSKYSDVEIQVEEKGTNIDVINFISQLNSNPIVVNSYLDVVVQTT